MLQQFADGVLGEELENIGKRKRVLFGKRDVEAVVGGGGLELKVEPAAKALAQGETPGLVDAAAEWRVKDELHTAGLVEKTLGDDRGEGGHRAQHGPAGDDVADKLLGRGIGDAALLAQPGGSGGHLRMPLRDVAGLDILRAAADLVAQVGNKRGQLSGALWRFPAPERDARRLAARVLDKDAARALNERDAPAGIAELDYVAGRGVDGEVLVERGDGDALGLGDDLKNGRVGDGAAV